MLSSARLPARLLLSRPPWAAGVQHARTLTLPRTPATRMRTQPLSSTPPKFFSDNFYPSPPPPPPPRGPVLRRLRLAARYGTYLLFSSVLGIGVLTGAVFVHDAFTYTDLHVDRVPVNPLALHPETGGPKNLPIARVSLRDEEDEETKALALKPKLVIVGGGWGVSVPPCVCLGCANDI